MKDKDTMESLSKAAQEITHEKLAVMSYYQATARLPEGNVSKTLGLASTCSVPSINVQSISVTSGGIIHVTFTDKANNAILLFTPKIESGRFAWGCSSPNVQKKKLLPQGCS